MELVKRSFYLDQLCKWKDHHLIKVLTGIRRAGKSTILTLFQAELKRAGVADRQIVAVNFENMDYSGIKTADDLWHYLKPKIQKGKTTYIFLDEIQQVQDFEKAVDGLFVLPNVDVYITGSNAYFLSGELATVLSGRYVTIHVHPFSFREYCVGMNLLDRPEQAWKNYLRFGSFPQVISLNNDAQLITAFNEGLYHTIIQKDILARRRAESNPAFDRVVAFMFDNIGNQTSVRSIVGALAAAGLKLSVNTVDEYLTRLCEAYLIYKVRPIDVQGKEHLKCGSKYYVADIGLRQYLLGSRAFDRGHILENIVYLELRRRYQEVFVGRNGTKEIDFIVRDSGEIAYFQVAETLAGDALREREFAPLMSIRDHYPKYILTLDATPPSNDNGIKTINVLDFLLS